MLVKKRAEITAYSSLFCRCGVRVRSGTVAVQDMSFQFDRWFHLLFVYLGPNTNGITIHLNNTFYPSTTIETSNPNTSATHGYDSTGEVIIGKLHVDKAGDYSNVMVDELTFWNRQLSEAEVEALRNQYLI